MLDGRAGTVLAQGTGMIDHAILGLLRDHPDCGYRLRRRLEHDMGSPWGLNPGQVYVALRRLAEQRLIVPTSDPEVGGNPGRQRWTMTPRGHAALEAWLRRPPAAHRPPRDEMLVRLLVMLPAERGLALAQAADLRASCEQLREQLEAEVRALGPERTSDTCRRLGLRAALAHVEAQILWLDECRRLLGPDRHEPAAASGG